MKILTVKDINCSYMTSSKYPQRDKDTMEMLTGLGFKPQRFDGGVTNPYTIGVARGHLEALRNTPLPALLIEDDARLVSNKPTNKELAIPIYEGMEALYLGTSIYGRIENKTIPGTVISTYSNYPEYVKIYNMLSMHAILYLTEIHRNWTIKLLEEFIKNPIGGVDDRIADEMPSYNVYCIQVPLFYQNDGHSDEQTKQTLWPKI